MFTREPGTVKLRRMAQSTPTVGVLGGGSWGTAIAHLCRLNGQRTLLWLRDQAVSEAIRKDSCNPRYLPDFKLAEGIETTDDLAEVASRCELIFVVVPTKVLREVARALGDSLRADHILVTCSKGLEPGSAKRMTEILREETCCLRVGALSGPNLAAEILKGDPSATVVASRYDEVIARATGVLMGPRFRVYGNRDVLGVELGGALKNVIAIAAGVSSGLGFGDNTKALLITRGLAEIRRLGVRLGADPMTFAGLAGVGDLMVTCASALSRNHQVGFRLAQGQSLGEIRDAMRQVAEGVNTATVAKALGERYDVPMHITGAVHGLLNDGRKPGEVLSGLMALEAMYEIDRAVTPQ